MAKGDVVSDVQDIASGANLDFQPSAGVNVLVTEIGHEAAAVLYQFDGTTTINAIVSNLDSGEDSNTMRFIIDNTNYLRLFENSVALRNIGYCGIQTK